MEVTTLTPEQIAEIRQRAENATPGPWAYDEPKPATDTTPADKFTWVYSGSGYEREYVSGTAGRLNIPDAAFVAASRTDIPALCDSHDALAARIAELERVLAQRDKALAEAPHGDDCALHFVGISGDKPCDCWKSALDQKEPGA